MPKKYLERIWEVANQGDDREESYYSNLEELFKTYTDSSGHFVFQRLPDQIC